MPSNRGRKAESRSRQRQWRIACLAPCALAAALMGCEAGAIGDGATGSEAASRACGNGHCGGSETCRSCPADCGGCPDSGSGSFADSGAVDSGASDTGAADTGSAPSPYGPTNGAQWVRDHAGPQTAITNAPWSGLSYVTLSPGNSQATNQSMIDAAGDGARVYWPAGRYYLDGSGGYSPRSGQTWLLQTPAPGVDKTAANTAILTRGQQVTTWVADGTGLYYATGQTQDSGDGTTRTGAPALNPLFYTEREDYWLDAYKDVTGNPTVLWPVATKAALAGTTNRRWFDNANNTVWIGFNPSGHTIHRTVSPSWDANIIGLGGKHDVTIRGGVMEMSAGNIVTLACCGGLEANILVEQATIRYAHGIPLTLWGDFVAPENEHLPSGMTVRSSYVGWGGAYAMAGQRMNDFTFESNEVSYGNWGPSGARGIDDEGMQKFGGVFGWEMFRYNWVHHNNSSIWWDTRANGLRFEENVVEDNPMGYGLMLEDAATSPIYLLRNLFRDNGYDHPWFRDQNGRGCYYLDGNEINFRGQMRLNATDGLEIAYNDFETTASGNVYGYHKEIEFGFQLRATGMGPINSSIHHNRFSRRIVDGAATSEYRGKGFVVGEPSSGSYFIGSASTNAITTVNWNNTANVAHGLSNGTAVVAYTWGSMPSPLIEGATYYVRDATTYTFTLASSAGGAAIDLTSDGSGSSNIGRYINAPYRTRDDNIWDRNEYHVPAGTSGNRWFRTTTGHTGETWTEWRTQRQRWGTAGDLADPSHYDPSGTLTDDL